MFVILNILWLVFGGIWMAAAWVVAAIVMAITIVGLPWARSALEIAHYTLLPFGNRVVSREAIDHRASLATGPLGFVGNIIWLLFAGWWLALAHLMTAILWAITIVGLPFAGAHLKLAGLALWPMGRTVVPAGLPVQRSMSRQ